MKTKKLLILCCVIAAFCFFFFLVNRNREASSAGSGASGETHAQQNLAAPAEETSDNRWEESDFKYGTFEYSYSSEAGEEDIKSLLTANQRQYYFEYEAYYFLWSHGYDEITEIRIYGGTEEDSGYFRFPLDAVLPDGKILTVWTEYNTQLLTFYFYFEDDILQAEPVELRNIPPQLFQIISENLTDMERDFGQYVFNEKCSASSAEVDTWEQDDDTVNILVILDDEYQTYFRIYYHPDSGEYEFKKWGELHIRT